MKLGVPLRIERTIQVPELVRKYIKIKRKTFVILKRCYSFSSCI